MMATPHPPGDTTTTELLPEILSFEIQPRLPLKTLLYFMCVCKEWYSFLKSGVFSKAYHHHVTTDIDHHDHQKHLVLSTAKPYRFRTMDCEKLSEGLTPSRPVPFEAEHIWILASLHGLLCVGLTTSDRHKSHEYSDFILWNPFTSEYKTLSKESFHEDCYLTSGGTFGLYYCSSEDDYKLLRITKYNNVYIYSLRFDSWRKVESTMEFLVSKPVLYSLCEVQPCHAMLNDKLYFITPFNLFYSIWMFDTKSEKFREIRTPCFGVDRSIRCLSFSVLRGCIHLCVAILQVVKDKATHAEMMELWRMVEDGDWKKVGSYEPTNYLVWSYSLHLMRNGDWLVQDGRYAYQADMNKPEKPKTWVSYKDMRIHSRGKYIETTVSPNQYMK